MATSTPSAGSTSSAPAQTGFSPAAVSFASTSVGWVLGQRGCEACSALAFTGDAGKHWSLLPAPPVGLAFATMAGAAVTDVYFADRRHGYLFGPGLEASADAGHTWRREQLPPVLDLVGDGEQLYALTGQPASAKVALWHSVVGSGVWTPLALPGNVSPPAGANTINRRIYASAGSLVLLAPGEAGPEPTFLGRLWLSQNAGRSWVEKSIPCTKADGGASIASTATAHPSAWLVDCYDGEQSSQAQNTLHHLFGTSDAGLHWTRLSDPATHGVPVELADNGAGSAVLATEGGLGDVLRASTDGARHWSTTVKSGGSFFGWAGLRFISPSTAYVVGPTHNAPSHLYQTTDAGRTWTAVEVSP